MRYERLKKNIFWRHLRWNKYGRLCVWQFVDFNGNCVHTFWQFSKMFLAYRLWKQKQYFNFKLFKNLDIYLRLKLSLPSVYQLWFIASILSQIQPRPTSAIFYSIVTCHAVGRDFSRSAQLGFRFFKGWVCVWIRLVNDAQFWIIFYILMSNRMY